MKNNSTNDLLTQGPLLRLESVVSKAVNDNEDFIHMKTEDAKFLVTKLYRLMARVRKAEEKLKVCK